MTAPVIFSLGELLVEFVSHKINCGLKELSEYSGPYPSGAPAICIDQASRMGARTKIFGGVGADSFGDCLVNRLRSSGVDTSGIKRITDKTTGVAFVSYFDDGSRTFIFHLNNTACDAIGDHEFRLPNAPFILHVSGASLGNPVFRSEIAKIIARIKTLGGKISCDPNARVELMQDKQASEALEFIMREANYLFPSTSDLEFLFPDKSESEAISTLKSYQPDILALKKGADGASIFIDDLTIDLAGYEVKEVDPTGAGDCFCGTFLAMIANGEPPEEAGLYANAAAAISVTRRGPMEGNSGPEEIRNFISSYCNTVSEKAV